MPHFGCLLGHAPLTRSCLTLRCAVPCCAAPLQVGDSLDIEVLRGNNKEHVTAVLEPNA